MENTKESIRPLRAYRGPLMLLAGGAIMPLAIGAALTVRGLGVPQCPSYYTQAQIDSGNCIIGANMSGIYILFAIPLVLLAIASAGIWTFATWRKRRHAAHN